MTTDPPSPDANSRRSGVPRTPRRTVFIFGILFFSGAVLWCLGGAGIYGSPLPALGSEGTVILAYLVATAGSSFVAAMTVFALPLFASRILKVAAAIGCLLGGRYLFAGYLPVDPVGAMLAFGIPAILFLLGGWLRSQTLAPDRQSTGHRHVDRGGSTAKARRLPPFQTSLRQLLLGTTVIALAVALGKLSEPPSNRQSEFMMDYSGSMPVTQVDRYSAKQKAGEDLRSILSERYQIELQMQGGMQGGGGSSHQTLAIRSNPHRRRGRANPKAPSGESSRPLIEDLRAGLKDVLAREGIEILNELDRPGLELEKRNKPGFSILYRTGDRKGLIQAVETTRPDFPERVVLKISERPETNLFALYPERHQLDPWEEDWSEFE